MTRYAIFILTVSLAWTACSNPTADKSNTNKMSVDSSSTTVSEAESVSDIYQASKKSLDSLFVLKRDSLQFNFQDLRTSLLLGHLFNKGSKHAVLRYLDNDSVTSVLVLRQSINKWDTIFSTKIFPVWTSFLDDLVQITDFNGDHIPDLKVVKTVWPIHTGDYSDCWLYNNDRFTKVIGFDSIVSAEYDSKTNLIYSYQSMGCADMAMYFGTFKIIDNKVKKIKEILCDCCTQKGDSCKIEIVGQNKSYSVPSKTLYKHVPPIFADLIKEKCEITSK